MPCSAGSYDVSSVPTSDIKTGPLKPPGTIEIEATSGFCYDNILFLSRDNFGTEVTIFRPRGPFLVQFLGTGFGTLWSDCT